MNFAQWNAIAAITNGTVFLAGTSFFGRAVTYRESGRSLAVQSCSPSSTTWDFAAGCRARHWPTPTRPTTGASTPTRSSLNRPPAVRPTTLGLRARRHRLRAGLHHDRPLPCAVPVGSLPFSQGRREGIRCRSPPLSIRRQKRTMDQILQLFLCPGAYVDFDARVCIVPRRRACGCAAALPEKPRCFRIRRSCATAASARNTIRMVHSLL